MVVDLFWGLCKLLMAVIIIAWPLYIIAGIIYLSVRVYKAVTETLEPVIAKADTKEKCEIKFCQIPDSSTEATGNTVTWSTKEAAPASTEQTKLDEVYRQKTSELDNLEASITVEESIDEISDEILEEISNAIPPTGKLNESELDDLANSL